ncbi:MAG: C40 family peptidase [Clostridia bacterium]|nr:C40 family peptidase [Clostridia bacterium]
MIKTFSKRPVCLLALCLAAVIILPYSAFAVERSPELDAALSMLEEGNPFITAYNEQTGADISARFPDGCPYFFGGKDVSLIGKSRKAWESSTYYKEGEWYPAGLDCVGFTRWVFAESGRSEHPSISALVGERGAACRIDMTEGQPALILFELLKVGDLLAIRHASGGYHIMMYIGTLRDFGFSQEEVGAKLRNKLDYPLMIHCSSNRDYTDRYLIWNRANAPWANTTDGGVMVSVFGCSEDDCDGILQNLDKTSMPYIDFKGYHLTVYNPDEGAVCRWIRWK